MSEIKGYVVRGKSALGLDVFCDSMGGHTGRLGVPAQVMQMPDRAAGERVRMLDRGCVDVRVYAVTEDGIEAPLPTYAAALDEVGQLCAEVNLARGRTMAALAEAERLRGEVDTMRGQRDAFRDHLDLAYRNADAERAEIERLRTLLAKVFGGEANEASLGQLVELAAEELTAVGAALTDAGVEAQGPDDALPARLGRLVEDANERAEYAESLDDVLARIVAAWCDDEIGQIDGTLIEEAEALLGIGVDVGSQLGEGPAS